MVKVLEMMKVPTKRAMPANTRRPLSMELICDAMRSAWSSASHSPVAVETPSGTTASSAARRSSWPVPGAARTKISSYSPVRWNSFCAVAVSKRARLPPAATAPSSVVKTPVRVGVRTGPSTDSRTVSPTWYPPSRAVRSSRATSSAPCGARPSASG
jgi:hypothetical protein